MKVLFTVIGIIAFIGFCFLLYFAIAAYRFDKTR
jgi:hypothetical protein